MARIVMKFGGTSVADLERIRNVARFVRREAEAGNAVIVVVSAMAGETNRLVALCKEAGEPAPGLGAHGVEYDAVVSSGEQVTSGLLALVLQNQGLRARSWQGWQIPLETDLAHGKARIADIDPEAIGAAIDGGEIAVVAGFQGVAPDGRIATLGRGGSDTTAVALAAAVGAARCDIYTDVDGVYTTDPRIHKLARRIDRISYEEMLEMASVGAKVLQTRSVELAMAYHVRVRVLSSFDPPEAPGPGTIICDEEDIVEKKIVSGITPSHDEAKISLLAVPDEPGRAAAIFTLLADANINVDMIVQSPSRAPGHANISFTIPEADLDRAVALLRDAKEALGYSALQSDRSVVKISVIGVGMKSHAGVASVMFKTLADRGINIQNISTSEIKISVLIDSQYAELAVRALHQAYGLDRTPGAP
ncbi:aspartate kinase [Amphiplicatus metriothermophilus]|uniref:Aspartokinase n=1 Tax=Amphiplicatus metriothermophilus TaxID=1519374 RepID=A0A239PTG1_9PROT|nr:aspartate kinase [Amphiplicatus metriothermophilus]MBB5519142.1 aspartate kinase [Amphiplicatus metriothermophilus]SNT73212.1 aspartate kinase [Amphiplicatus metriothermophilus]